MKSAETMLSDNEEQLSENTQVKRTCWTNSSQALIYLENAGDVLGGGVDDIRHQDRADREGLISGTQTQLRWITGQISGSSMLFTISSC